MILPEEYQSAGASGWQLLMYMAHELVCMYSTILAIYLGQISLEEVVNQSNLIQILGFKL